MNRHLRSRWFLGLLALLLPPAGALHPARGAEAAADADFYVAPGGDDGHPGTKSEPFKTLDRARDAVRELIARGLTRNVTVHLRGGTYRIGEPVVFGVQDSGSDEFSITYAASPGEQPVISGGRPIGGWQANPDGTWTASVADVASGKWRFRELFVNGRRAQRARHPDSGYLRLVRSGPDRRTSFEFKPGDVRSYDDVADVEVVYLHDWSISRVRARSVDESRHTVTLAQPIGAGGRGFWLICGFEQHPRYYLENSAAFLDAPGEWHLDERRGVVSYRPRPGETIAAMEAVAPVARQLLVVRGDPESGRPVRNLHFVGLRFEHCAFPLPAGGYAGIQAAFHQYRGGEAGDRSRTELTPAVFFELAERCRFADGGVAHTGGSAVGFGRASSNNTLVGNRITDVAGNGVMVGENKQRQVDGKPWWQAVPGQAASKNLIKNNLIEGCGRVFYGAVGIWVGLANHTTIAHNEVRDHPYTGVSVGWMWNPTPTPCKANIVENNHIHHVMQILSDGGGIYTLGRQPGTVLRGNVIHDVPLNAGRAESNGMFLDEGTTDMVIENNVIYNVVRSPLRFHKATVNLVRRNILVVAQGVPPVRYNATDPTNIKLEENSVQEVGLETPYRKRLLEE
jgi:hypothetical protein